ncbi:MAG TPA: hypothetical protein VFS43_14670 [Polyangiaceae bacterium]|nr:hypothetical protein [Polyangiaceae bacterium]
MVVRDPDGARPDAHVLAHDERGALVGRTKTAPDGSALIEVPPGGGVTIVAEQFFDGAPEIPRRHLDTFYGVDGSFELNHTLLGRRGNVGAGGAGGAPPSPSMNLKVTPTSPAGMPATRYLVSICDRAPASVEPGSSYFEFEFDACGRSTYDVLVVAIDGTGRAIGYGTVLDAPLVTSTSQVDHDVVTDRIDLVERDVIAQAGSDYYGGSFAVWATRDTSPPRTMVLRPSYDQALYPTKFWMPSGIFQRWEFSQSFIGKASNAISRFHEYRKSALNPPVDVAWSVDDVATIEELKRVEPTEYESAPWPTFRYRFSSEGALGDEAVYTVDQISQPWRWTVEMPPARTATVRMLELPDDLAAFRPPPEIPFAGDMVVSVELRDYVGIAGWPGRHHGGDTSECHVSWGENRGAHRASAERAANGRP